MYNRNIQKFLSHCPTLAAVIQAKKENTAADPVQQLATGLSTVTTIAQIRSVAKQVSGGGDTDE
ncbi:MAG: hypothetical protein K1V97_04065 [Lachnospiraceae bacterium]